MEKKKSGLLQHILFYREFEVNLEDIRKIIYSPTFEEIEILKEHHQRLLEKKNKIDELILNVEKTIKSKEGKEQMNDNERFEGFKQKMIDDNEAKYGKEVREKYGEEQVRKSNNKVKNMTKKQHEEITKLSEEIIDKLAIAFEQGDPASELAQEVAGLHKKWLTFYWDSYSKEAHKGLANMYVEDPRFTAYYDSKKSGTAKFLRDAILIYTSK